MNRKEVEFVTECKCGLEERLNHARMQQSTTDLYGRGVSKGLTKAMNIVHEWFMYDKKKMPTCGTLPCYREESMEGGVDRWYECPHCNETVGEPEGFRFNFCPECRAKMDWESIDKMEEEREKEIEGFVKYMEGEVEQIEKTT